MDFAHHSYYSSVARLNAEFADWVQQQVRKDKAVCLKQGIKDYTHKLERLEKETGVSVGNGPVTVVGRCPYSLTPRQITKVIHFVRHGNGYHNLPYMLNIVDPRLTPLGWAQAEQLRMHLAKMGRPPKIQVVVVSPLLRALETAAGIFGEPERGNGRSVLMKGRSESDKCPAHPPIFKPSTLDFVATELCRETLDGNNCAVRRCITDQRTEFPGIDFSEIKNDPDILSARIKAEMMDPMAKRRAHDLLGWLVNRRETHMAVVSHASFLGDVLDEACKHIEGMVHQTSTRIFANCEYRSYVLSMADTGSLSGLDESKWFLPQQFSEY